ncbi:MAG TPA: hypothetical protein VM264_00360, partial [Acidimicrobiales bacterium]|nr:hypothetical protein [Acidimicrobiales bacterium]
MTPVLGEQFGAVVEAARAGSPEAVARLYRTLHPALLRYLTAQAGQAAPIRTLDHARRRPMLPTFLHTKLAAAALAGGLALTGGAAAAAAGALPDPAQDFVAGLGGGIGHEVLGGVGKGAGGGGCGAARQGQPAGEGGSGQLGVQEGREHRAP